MPTTLRKPLVGALAAASLLGGSAVATFTPAPAQAAGTSTTVVAKVGSTGSTVTKVQNALIKLRYLGSGYNTGYYGSLTKAAVIKFQGSMRAPKSGALTKGQYAALLRRAAAVRTPAVRASVVDRRCLTVSKALCVNKTTKRLYYVEHGKVVDDFSIRFGLGGYATREGTFSIFRKEANSWSRLYHVNMPYAMYFSGGQAVHYSAQFATYGWSLGGSHGCVNMRDYAGIKKIYKRAPLGTRVVVYR